MNRFLEKILDAAHNLLQDSKYIPPKKGTKKKGKKNYDDLLWALCTLFKKYTGKIPNAYVGFDEKVVGEIIPFLQAALPLSSYSFSITGSALEKKIREMKKSPNYKSLWNDARS